MTRPPVRLLDRLLAAAGLLGATPVLLLAALGIKISDRGPVLYRACRVGLGGTTFTMYKFRTMRVTSGPKAPITSRSDPRVFPWGRCLRRLKLDELPQLVNVVKGDMAIVGPRPEDPTIVERHYADWMRETLTVVPGLTSPGSLNYYADEATLPHHSVEAQRIYVSDLLPRKIAVDLVYVRNRSIKYDAVLVLRTIVGVVGIHRTFNRTRAREAAESSRILAEVGG